MSTRPQAGSSSEGIDNFQLPKALVTRIAKSALPHDAKLQKDTISAIVNGATVFINYLAATAQDVAFSRSRKTIAGPDILKALEIIEFGDLVPLLEDELESYRGVGKSDKEKRKSSDIKAKSNEKDALLAASDPLDAQTDVPCLAGEDDGAHEQEPTPEMLKNVEERDEGRNDEDVGMAEAEAEARDEQEEQEEEEEEEEEEADEDVEDDIADESEELVDMLAVEETELQKDQRGLEDTNPQ